MLGAAVLVLCLFALPIAITSTHEYYRPIWFGMYVPAVPFFIALRQALRLLNYIEKNVAFSDLSVQALKKIKYCAIAICSLYVIGMPYVFYIAGKDNATGMVAVGLIIVFASLVIAIASAVFQRLLQNAVDIKSENDLTV